MKFIPYPSWRFSREGSRIINGPDEEEDGWYDSPALVPSEPEKRKPGRPRKVKHDDSRDDH